MIGNLVFTVLKFQNNFLWFIYCARKKNRTYEKTCFISIMSLKMYSSRLFFKIIALSELTLIQLNSIRKEYFHKYRKSSKISKKKLFLNRIQLYLSNSKRNYLKHYYLENSAKIQNKIDEKIPSSTISFRYKKSRYSQT